jgi:uncharacterized protein (DUF4415 family)
MSEERITRMKMSDILKMKGDTDWERLRTIRDEDIPPDDPEDVGDMSLMDWSKPEFFVLEPKKAVSIRLDPDVLAFYKAGGRGYQTRINAVLRSYMQAKKIGQVR